MSDTARQQAEREAAASRVMARADPVSYTHLRAHET